MVSVPFYDFDEAHRAENAKRMKEYKSFFVPLTGSSQDRVEHLKIPLRENPDLHLYYHLERPPLIYDLMIISTTCFGSTEWAYRLPSFLLGMAIFITFLVFAIKENKKSIIAIASGFLVLFASSDIWLSSQYAQMDTGISLFLFLSLLSLIYYCSVKKNFLIIFSGIFFGLGVLSKLQPTIIFIFPIVFLLILKKLNLRDLAKFLGGFLIIVLPWLLYLIFKFGIKDVSYIMPGFAISSASIMDIHHKAPFFWYARWWWESFRPGWTLFLAFLIYDLAHLNLPWKKITILSYIIGGFLAFSVPTNKLWWYILPLIPAVSFYIFLAVKDYLERNGRVINLSFAIIVASLPAFLGVSNKISMIYGLVATVIVFLILIDKLTMKISFGFVRKNIFAISLLLSLCFFLLQFPKIIPYHRNAKEVAQFYKNLPGEKCLWLGDMPGEAVLFYSDAGEVPPLQVKDHSAIFTNCNNNYLISPDRYGNQKPIIRRGSIRLYQLNK